ncbi:unnamed protein product [Fraxinus pennsylvanica]|uniref:DUF7812 domain-containing protein n=1 Tax=Fraxinus pennsylvanica TaxID=56036 RepID=A0AAD2DKZ1_9LAMI|nr:unnamed protein product [Fraxinus pennsylvanica]
MGSPKKRRGKKKRAETEIPVEDDNNFDNYRTFRTLLRAIQSPQGIKPPVLKSLYLLLVHLSSIRQWSVKCAVGLNDFDLEIYHEGIKVAFGDVCRLSDVLFKEINERFKHFLALCENLASKNFEEVSSHSDLLDAAEIVNLLLRCCLVLLILLVAQQNLFLEKGLILFRILRQLSSPNSLVRKEKSAFNFEKSVSHECARGDSNCTTSYAEDFTASFYILEPSNLYLFFQSAMLEVFLDELSIHGQLRGYFKLIDSVASIGEKLLISHSTQGDIGVVMEVICTHFLKSFSDELAFEGFLVRLFGICAKELRYSYRAPEISLVTAASLLLNPIMISAPKYMQAHLISLVSEANYMIDIESPKPDRKLMNCFLSVFEKSVVLYMKHMSSLEIDGYSLSGVGCDKSNISDERLHPLFESYILPETKQKINTLISRLDDSSRPKLHGIFIKMKSDLVSSAMTFVKEMQTVFEVSCRDDILAILSCLILRASESFNDTAIHSIEGTSLQDVYLLASLLKLMSTSLGQAVQRLRQGDDLGCLKTLKDFSSCKEYDFIMGIITTFRNFGIQLPTQQVLSNEMSSHVTTHTVSKMMFLHFYGLMSLSFVSGLDCLVKGCLLTIIAILNLFVFEEGSLDALQSMVDSNKESFPSGLLHVKFQETVVDQNSSLVVASKFQKTRTLYLRDSLANKSKETGDLSAPDMEGAIGLEEETEETSNGKIFFKCLLKEGEKMSDFDDLADFVECKQGKDYSNWLRNRYRYRKWKCEKMAVLKWKKKKKTWRTFKGKKIGVSLF